jgi:hypothetical protein
MGYTHYWYYNPSKAKSGTSEPFSKALAAIKEYKALLESRDLVLRGPMGEGPAELTPEVIAYNGDASEGLDHESFCVEREFQATRSGFSFCKTARKPYDTLVCLSLISMFEAFADPEVFSYCSDGSDDEEEWCEAYKVYREVNSKEPPSLAQAAPPERAARENRL